MPDHIRSTALDTVPLDATVHVLGASLGAYDVVNRLFAPDTGCRFARVGEELQFVAVPMRATLCCVRAAGVSRLCRAAFPAPLIVVTSQPVLCAQRLDPRG